MTRLYSCHSFIIIKLIFLPHLTEDIVLASLFYLPLLLEFHRTRSVLYGFDCIILQDFILTEVALSESR